MGRGRERSKTYLEQLLPLELKGVIPYLRNIGAEATCSWSNGSAASLVVTETGLTLKYAINEAPYSQHVPVTYTPCNYGKDRPWMLCPKCNKRVGKLYMWRSYFCCRTCTGLKYRAQSLAPEDRGTYTIHKLQKKLDAAGGYEIYENPEKPPRMHETTYERIMGKLEEVRDKREVVLDARLARYMARSADIADLLGEIGMEVPKQGRPPKDFWTARQKRKE